MKSVSITSLALLTTASLLSTITLAAPNSSKSVSSYKSNDMVHVFGWMEDACSGEKPPYKKIAAKDTAFIESIRGQKASGDFVNYDSHRGHGRRSTAAQGTQGLARESRREGAPQEHTPRQERGRARRDDAPTQHTRKGHRDEEDAARGEGGALTPDDRARRAALPLSRRRHL